MLKKKKKKSILESVSQSLVAQLCLTLYDPMDCSPKLLCPWNSPGKNIESGLPFPSPGIKPGSPALQADSLAFKQLRSNRIT